MLYKGYEVTAEVENYDFFAIDADGSPTHYVKEGNVGDVTGYHFENGTTGDAFFQAASESDGETLRALVDAHLGEVEA